MEHSGSVCVNDCEASLGYVEACFVPGPVSGSIDWFSLWPFSPVVLDPHMFKLQRRARLPTDQDRRCTKPQRLKRNLIPEQKKSKGA